MTIRSTALVAIIAMIGGLSPVSAAIMDATYAGTISGGFDRSGAFTTNGFPTGSSWIATYTYDTTLGSPYFSPALSYVYGGSLYGTASPILSSSVTIDGTTVAVDASRLGQVAGQNFGPDGIVHTYHAENYNGARYEYLVNYIFNYTGTLTTSIAAPFTYTFSLGDHAVGYYEIQSDSGSLMTYITANISTLTVSDHIQAGVPEASTWAMMILGFVGIGSMAYRRKAKRKLLTA